MTLTATAPPRADPHSADPHRAGDHSGIGWSSATVDPDGRVVLCGELDIASLDVLRTALDDALFHPSGPVLVDMAGLTFIDSRAISELLRYELVATACQRELRLVHVPRPVARILDVLDLRHILMAPGDRAMSSSASGGVG